MFHCVKYQGSTVIGEKGQVVIPAETRKKFGLKPGDKFVVMAAEKEGTDAWGIVFVKADVLAGAVEKMFGGDLKDILESPKE